jgi:hypothetical protein
MAHPLIGTDDELDEGSSGSAKLKKRSVSFVLRTLPFTSSAVPNFGPDIRFKAGHVFGIHRNQDKNKGTSKRSKKNFSRQTNRRGPR